MARVRRARRHPRGKEDFTAMWAGNSAFEVFFGDVHRLTALRAVHHVYVGILHG